MFRIKQNDTSPAIKALLKDGRKRPINLNGASIRFHMKDENENVVVDDEAEVLDEEKGEVVYYWKENDTNLVGTCLAEFQVTYNDGKIETFPNTNYIRIGIIAEIA